MCQSKRRQTITISITIIFFGAVENNVCSIWRLHFLLFFPASEQHFLHSPVFCLVFIAFHCVAWRRPTKFSGINFRCILRDCWVFILWNRHTALNGIGFKDFLSIKRMLATVKAFNSLLNNVNRTLFLSWIDFVCTQWWKNRHHSKRNLFL